MVPDLLSAARGSPWLKTISSRIGSILIPEVLRPYMGIDRIPARGLGTEARMRANYCALAAFLAATANFPYNSL